MARLLKLVVALAVLYATWQGGVAFWRNYQFRDALTTLAVSGTRAPSEQLHARAVVLARDLNIPVAPEQITVTRAGDRLVIEAKYIDQIQVLPSYRYPYLFTARGEAPILP